MFESLKKHFEKVKKVESKYEALKTLYEDYKKKLSDEGKDVKDTGLKVIEDIKDLEISDLVSNLEKLAGDVKDVPETIIAGVKELVAELKDLV